MKKFIITLMMLIIVGGAVFVWGWLQLFIPTGSYGVMISKTGGVYNKTIISGGFDWRYERLIPTNTKLLIFKDHSKVYNKTLQGTLPSANLYKKMIEDDTDFSYNMDIGIQMSIDPKAFPAFVQKTGSEAEHSLDEYLDSQATSIAHDVVELILEKNTTSDNYILKAVLSEKEVLDALNAKNRYPNLIISAIYINNVHLPDTQLYLTAKAAYLLYQTKMREATEKLSTAQGGKAAEDYLELERFSKLGQILSEYPLLIDFLSVSGGKINPDIQLPNNPQLKKTDTIDEKK